MTILCNVNQTECLRWGIDAPSSTVKIEVDPKSLGQAQRDFLADQLHTGLRFPANADFHICPPTYEGLLAVISYGMKCEKYDEQTESRDALTSIREKSVWRNEAITQALRDMETRIADESKKADEKAQSKAFSSYSQSNPDPAQLDGTLKMFQIRSK